MKTFSATHARYKATERHGRLKTELNLKYKQVSKQAFSILVELCVKVVGASSSEGFLVKHSDRFV